MQRAEAERWLGIAAKLLAARDFLGSKTFALRAREADPHNTISDQILAIVDTVLAGEKRVNSNQQPDWYGVLQLPQLVRDGEVIADQYRRLVVCLNPERNKFPFADYALQLVVDAWSVLGDVNKKWLFDCQLGLYLQSQGGGGGGGGGGGEVDAVGVDPVVDVNVIGGGVIDGGIGVSGGGRGNVSGGGGGGGGGGYQLNTFQLFQPQAETVQQQSQQQQQQLWQSQPQSQNPQQQQMWQSRSQSQPQPQPQSQSQPQSQIPQQQQQFNFMHVQNQPQSQQQQQMNFMQQQPQSQQQQQQINFMHLQNQPQSQSQQQQQHNFMHLQNQPQSQQQQQHNFMHLQNQPQSQQQQIPPQWQMPDSAPLQGGGGGGGGSGVGGGERNRGIGGERNIGILNAIGGVTTGVTENTTIRPVPRGMPQGLLSSTPVTMARVSATTRVGSGGVDGNASGTASTNYYNNSSRVYNDNINYNNHNDYDDDDVDGDDGYDDGNLNGGNTDDVVVEEVDCFWTACPYCFYVFEYQKMYQDCTLRCQNCRRGFHALQIPTPPSIANGGGGGGKEKGKERGNPFCTWGFVPLGFSMKAWKKQIQVANLKGSSSSSWEPFTPLISCPVENGGGGFKWFDAAGGSAFVGPKGGSMKSTPWVYIDDDLIDVSEPSDLDMSDGDWRAPKHNINKKRKSMTIGGSKRGRPRRDMSYNRSDFPVVVLSLPAGDKSHARTTASAARARKLNGKTVKNVERLDLNVEFNNNGEDQAPRASAVTREDDGIENIAFFEGLDEFMSSLPILNVNGDGKSKPS